MDNWCIIACGETIKDAKYGNSFGAKLSLTMVID